MSSERQPRPREVPDDDVDYWRERVEDCLSHGKFFIDAYPPALSLLPEEDTIPSGIVVVGQEGTGKTALARLLTYFLVTEQDSIVSLALPIRVEELPENPDLTSLFPHLALASFLWARKNTYSLALADPLKRVPSKREKREVAESLVAQLGPLWQKHLPCQIEKLTGDQLYPTLLREEKMHWWRDCIELIFSGTSVQYFEEAVHQHFRNLNKPADRGEVDQDKSLPEAVNLIMRLMNTKNPPTVILDMAASTPKEQGEKAAQLVGALNETNLLHWRAFLSLEAGKEVARRFPGVETQKIIWDEKSLRKLVNHRMTLALSLQGATFSTLLPRQDYTLTTENLISKAWQRGLRTPREVVVALEKILAKIKEIREKATGSSDPCKEISQAACQVLKEMSLR